MDNLFEKEIKKVPWLIKLKNTLTFLILDLKYYIKNICNMKK